MTRVLLLAGTSEARQIAGALSRLPHVEAIASLAGATRAPQSLGVQTRVGGFGGAEGFAGYLRAERIDAVLDATHPFAARMSRRSHAICSETGVPYAQVLRPEWCPEQGDDWVFLDDEDEAPRHIAEGSTVFLATGRQTLDRYAGLKGSVLYVRQIESAPEAFPFPRGGWVVGRPPFPVEDEIALFERLGIDWLVVKNAGGDASRSKLDAARALGVRVAMIRRPVQPAGVTLDSVEAAVDWVRRRG